MAEEKNQTSLSPTVTQVLDQFIASLRADDAIQNDTIDRLEMLLKKGAVPKPDDINTALFGTSLDGDS